MYPSERTTMLGEIPKRKLQPMWKHHVAFASRTWRTTENVNIDCMDRYRKFQPRCWDKYKKTVENLRIEHYRRDTRKIQKILEKYSQNIENLRVTSRG
jgi:hypothetical protein